MIEEPEYNRKKRRKKGKTKKEWEELREAPITGISTMADGSLVSAPISGKALPRLGRAIRSSMTSGVITGDQNPLTRVDGNENGLIFDGTWREMPDPTPGNRGGVSGRIGRRDNPTQFVGLDTLLAKHFAQSEMFDEWEKNNDWNAFHRNHFDWWMFPMPRGSNSYGDGYNITGEPLETLRANEKYMQSLAKSVRQYLRAMAWDVDKNNWVDNADVNNGQNPIRNINSARLYKIAQSTYAHGMMDEHRSIRKMANSLIDSGVRVGNEEYWAGPVGVSGRMANGNNINPTIYPVPNGENVDPFSEDWKNLWDSRDDMSSANNDKLWDWKNEEDRIAYAKQIRLKKVKKGFLSWGEGNTAGKTLTGTSLELLPMYLKLFGLIHQRKGTGYPGFSEPYTASIFTHSQTPKGVKADANIVSDMLGQFYEDGNPFQFYTRFENWIRNPFVVIRDPKTGIDVGVRKYFDNNRQLMLTEFRARVKSFFDAAFMKEHGKTWDEFRGSSQDLVEVTPKEILNSLKTSYPDVVEKSKTAIEKIIRDNPNARSMHRLHSMFSNVLSLRASPEDIRLVTPGVLREIIKESTPSFDDEAISKFPDFFKPDIFGDLSDEQIELAKMISDSLIAELIEFDGENVLIPQVNVSLFAETLRDDIPQFTDNHARSILTDSVLRLNPQNPGSASGKMSSLQPTKSMKDYIDDPQLDIDGETVGKSIGFWGGWPVTDDPEFGRGYIGSPSRNYKNHPVYSYDLETGKPVKILGQHSTSQANIEAIVESKKYKFGIGYRAFGNFGEGGNFSFDGDPYMAGAYGDDLGSEDSIEELEKTKRLVVRLELENPIVVNVGVLEPTEDTKYVYDVEEGARKNRDATRAERQEEYIKQLGGTERVRGLYKLLLDAAKGGDDSPAGVKISFKFEPSPEQIKYYEKIVNGGEINMDSSPDVLATQELNLLARAAGHDGIVWINTPGDGVESSHVIIFDEDKIKVLGARPAYNKETVAYWGDVIKNGRDWSKYHEAIAKRENSQPSPGSVSGKMSTPDSIEAEYIGYNPDNPESIANHMLSPESSYDVRPKPVKSIQEARDTGAPLEWLIPGNYPPEIEEILSEVTDYIITNGYTSIEDVQEMGTGLRDDPDNFKAMTGEKAGELQAILSRLGFGGGADRELSVEEQSIVEALAGVKVKLFSEVPMDSEDPRAAMLKNLILLNPNANEMNQIALGLIQRAATAGFKTNFLSTKSGQGSTATEQTLELWQKGIQSAISVNAPEFIDVEPHELPTELAVAMPIQATIQMLQSGKFKTLFESGTSRGNSLDTIRRVQEFALFGYLPSFSGQRPVYGFTAPDGITEGGLDATHHYGPIKLVMKPDVNSRSTWTESDSLSLASTASSFSNPSKHALFNQEIKGDLKSFLSKESGYTRFNYTETQIHGGITTDDVAYIVVDDRFYNEGWRGVSEWPTIDENGQPIDDPDWENPDNLEDYGPYIQISRIAQSLNIPIVRASEVAAAGEDEVFRP